MTEINFKDHISDERMTEIIEEEFRSFVSSKAKEDYERVALNGAYLIVWKYLDEQLEGKLDQIVKDQALNVVQGLSAYDVFRVPGIGERGSSVARQVLDNAIRDNKELVSERVKEVIKDLSRSSIWELIEEKEITFNK